MLYYIEIIKTLWWLLVKFHRALNPKALSLLYFMLWYSVSNMKFHVCGSLFSSKFHTISVIWANDLQLNSFSVTLTAMLIYWQQYKSLSSNVSLVCDKTDNKDKFFLGTAWTIGALKDINCALQINYLLNKILRNINTGLRYHNNKHVLMQKCMNI